MKTTETQEMLNAVREFSAPEYEMTEAEATAFKDDASKPRPKITAKSLPTKDDNV